MLPINNKRPNKRRVKKTAKIKNLSVSYTLGGKAERVKNMYGKPKVTWSKDGNTVMMSVFFSRLTKKSK